ncbi:super-infection exclusion protein B [Staphylococcus hominis]|uniref:super-infection exclusion protein B n=1 Tax=Staphylococcus hominis TaxID=1290 RepID=UPI0030194CBD
MSGIGKILEFVSKPINFTVLLATFLTTLLLTGMNFFNESVLEKIHINKFLQNYGFIIFILLIASFFLLIVQVGANIIKKRKDKKFFKYFKENQDRLFNDEEALIILKKLYDNHPHAVQLPYLNQKVRLLQQFQLITPAVSSWETNAINPHMPYMLQPEAEKRIKDKLKNSKSS